MRKANILGFSAALLMVSLPSYAYDTPYSNNCNSSTLPCILGTQNSSTINGSIEGDVGNGGTGVWGKDTTASAPGGTGVAGSSDYGYGVIGTTGQGYGVYAAASVTGSTALYAYYGGGNTYTGYAVYADAALSGYGVYSHSANGTAVYATATNGDGVNGNASGSSSGVSGHNSGSGAGVYATSSSGHGVEAYGDTALWGYSGNTGVYGYGTNYGVYAESATLAVYGGGSGTGSHGVYGNASGTNSIGLIGECSGSGCYALLTNGSTYLGGNIYGTGTNFYSSDERLKKDIQPLKGSLDKLMQLNGVSFEWKEPSKHGDMTGMQRGFIAQDYEKVFPNWVTTDKDGSKMISTTGLDALEVESIRELKAQNDDLKSRLSALENSRKVVVAGNAWGFAIGGLAVACALVVARRKKEDEKAE